MGLWNILASVATIVAAIVVSFAAYLAVRQLKEMTKSRNLEGMLRIYEMIASEDARRSRRFIYEKLKSEPQDVSDEERRYVEDVSVMFDRVGALAEAGLIPEALLFQSHGEVITRMWDRLEPHILYRRRQPGNATHVSHFEKLAMSARKYQAARRLKIDSESACLSTLPVLRSAEVPSNQLGNGT
ncbi:MAG TPA: DUF4760 domain-containing protein [Streptosporangiaceae bacterium]|nr:DUF4760 domain-containing protein [Streptosporangiaceae bacterium]